jgi:hypothetical protein
VPEEFTQVTLRQIIHDFDAYESPNPTDTFG